MNKKHTTGIIISGAIILIVLAVGMALLKTGTKSFSNKIDTLRTKTPPPESVLKPPRIPETGLYLGARVNPEDRKGNEGKVAGTKQIEQLDDFNKSIGRSLTFHALYIPFGDSISQESLLLIDKNGSMPFVNLACTNLEEITNGKYDKELAEQAIAMQEFGKPAFLRFYWEMNKETPEDVERGCNAFNKGAAFISAWQHIWQIFKENGATNVAFVWCPSAGSKYTAQYYPGDEYVDWIAGDGFYRNKKNQNEFADIYGNFYNEWVGRGKPMMIGATGAQPENQVAYFTELQEKLPTQYPEIKAFNYFNAVGNNGDFTLQGAGLEAFKKMANSPYFMYGYPYDQ